MLTHRGLNGHTDCGPTERRYSPLPSDAQNSVREGEHKGATPYDKRCREVKRRDAS
jgi:hypothetical protein